MFWAARPALSGRSACDPRIAPMRFRSAKLFAAVMAVVLAVAAQAAPPADAASHCAPRGAKNKFGQVCRPDAVGVLWWGSPYRVFLYGDSLSFESAPYVQKAVTASGRATFTNRSFPGTAPCDWFAAMDRDRSPYVPDAVIVTPFGNNSSACEIHDGLRPKYGSPAYWQMYKVMLTAVVNRYRRPTLVVLAAAPVARNDLAYGRGASQKGQMLALLREVAAGRSHVVVVDAGAAVEGSDRRYVRSLPCLPLEPCPNSPKLGRAVVRAQDGVHLCPSIFSATIALLGNCPVYSSGAWRLGTAQSAPVVQALGL